jgi:beta-barrel assembly-enhancing protease
MYRPAASLALGALALTAACSVSESDERAIGAEEAASVDSELPILRDTVVTAFVAKLGQSIASRTSRADLEWRFAVVNTVELNAFSLPGGFIYLNRGLIEHSDRLDELAGVMGHEIGHVVRRHSVKQLQKGAKRDVGVVLVCTLTRACHTLGGAIAVQTGADAMTARYSQRDETEADSEAVINTVRAGFDPEGLPAFLQWMLGQRTDQPTAIEAFFATHPTDQARIAALERQIAKVARSPQRALVRDTPEFQSVRQHLRALPPPADTLGATQRQR